MTAQGSERVASTVHCPSWMRASSQVGEPLLLAKAPHG